MESIQMKTTYRSGKVEYTAFSARNVEKRIRAAKHLGQIVAIDKAEVSGDEENPTYTIVESIWKADSVTVAAPAVDVAAIKKEAAEAAANESKAALDQLASEKDAALATATQAQKDAQAAKEAADATAKEAEDLKKQLAEAQKALEAAKKKADK